MKELLDSMLDFLKENFGDNYIFVIGGAAAVLLILIIVLAVKGRKKGTEEADRDYFLEGEYDTIIRDAALAAKAGRQAAALEDEVSQQPVTEAAEELAEAAETAELTEPEIILPAEEPEVIEGSQEERAALKEELQQVQININIERGQVKIGYEEDGKVTCVVETEDELPAVAEAVPEVSGKEAGESEEKAEETPQSQENTVPPDFIAGQGIVLEKINLIKAAPAKKFGPGNLNTSRSGRVFTEEELREQIKQ